MLLDFCQLLSGSDGTEDTMTKDATMQVGIFLTNQNPPGRDMVSALEEQ
jgi:hypothetical protein